MAQPPRPDSGPLLFEELHRRVKEIQPLVFEGIKLGLDRPLSQHFQLAHHVNMGLLESGYKFGASFMGTKRISPVEAYPIIASEITCDGTLNANLTHLITPRLKAKLVGSFERSSCVGSQVTFDYKGDNFTTSLTAANVDLIANNGILVGHYLHQATKSIAIGPELVIQYGPTRDSPLTCISQLSVGGRFNQDKYHVDATLTSRGAHLSYCRRANDNLHLGAEFSTDSKLGQSSAGFCYQYDLTKSHTTFKGSIDTKWNVEATVEKRFFPLPVLLSMSAVLNHMKNSTKVGIGLTVG